MGEVIATRRHGDGKVWRLLFCKECKTTWETIEESADRWQSRISGLEEQLAEVRHRPCCVCQTLLADVRGGLNKAEARIAALTSGVSKVS